MWVILLRFSLLFGQQPNPFPLFYWVSFIHVYAYSPTSLSPSCCGTVLFRQGVLVQSFSVVFTSLPVLYLVECFPAVIPDHCFNCYMYLCFTYFSFFHFSLCFSIVTLSGRNCRTFSWKLSLSPVNLSYIRNAYFVFFNDYMFNSYC